MDLAGKNMSDILKMLENDPELRKKAQHAPLHGQGLRGRWQRRYHGRLILSRIHCAFRSCWSTEVHTAARSPHPPTTQPPHDARARLSTDRARAAPPQDRSRSRPGRAGPAARPPSAKSSTADAARDRCSDAAGLPAPTRTEYDSCERIRMREQLNVSVDRVLVCSGRYIAKRCQS